VAEAGSVAGKDVTVVTMPTATLYIYPRGDIILGRGRRGSGADRDLRDAPLGPSGRGCPGDRRRRNSGPLAAKRDPGLQPGDAGQNDTLASTRPEPDLDARHASPVGDGSVPVQSVASGALLDQPPANGLVGDRSAVAEASDLGSDSRFPVTCDPLGSEERDLDLSLVDVCDGHAGGRGEEQAGKKHGHDELGSDPGQG